MFSFRLFPDGGRLGERERLALKGGAWMRWFSLSTRFGSLLGGNGKPRAGCGRVQVEKHAASQRELQAGVFAGRDRRATALASVVQRWDLACVLL